MTPVYTGEKILLDGALCHGVCDYSSLIGSYMQMTGFVGYHHNAEHSVVATTLRSYMVANDIITLLSIASWWRLYALTLYDTPKCHRSN